MTKANAKELSKDVIIPSTVALALVALVARSYGLVPAAVNPDAEWKATVISRQIEFERLYREDRNEMMRLLMTLNGRLERIEGKLEK